MLRVSPLKGIQLNGRRSVKGEIARANQKIPTRGMKARGDGWKWTVGDTIRLQKRTFQPENVRQGVAFRIDTIKSSLHVHLL